MKIRKEISGLHLFDRSTGIHMLADEISYPVSVCCGSPRTVSIAITNVCDLHCYFCYAPKNQLTLSFDYIKELAPVLDNLGVLELTIGGGEPVLHPDFVQICKWLWDNTSLALSVTTNGHHLSSEIINDLIGKISSVRFSIDGVEPYYSSIRGKPLSRLIPIIESIDSRIPTAINIVVSPGKVNEVRNVIELATKHKIYNILLIPEHLNGRFLLSALDWDELNQIVLEYQSIIELNITQGASGFIHASCLTTEAPGEFLFAHISADKKLKLNSFSDEGQPIEDLNQMRTYFTNLYHNQERDVQ